MATEPATLGSNRRELGLCLSWCQVVSHKSDASSFVRKLLEEQVRLAID